MVLGSAEKVWDSPFCVHQSGVRLAVHSLNMMRKVVKGKAEVGGQSLIYYEGIDVALSRRMFGFANCVFPPTLQMGPAFLSRVH
jgi:hypothetical protein